METQNVSTERSPTREATNETISLEENATVGGLDIEMRAEIPSDTPLKVQNLD
ncbi:hypothetical protein RHMOL_Rhmol05G0150000 [Rhododendron molle]|uniref:Uncharacterized protein n=1 Tax=Rhododendron molle TaxID=49168 RepID=A0ACC0NQE7_RHOML|nr:hypothetical protein RHMOL_Rhmol05G0150000 [Rhododendron molle]